MLKIAGILFIRKDSMIMDGTKESAGLFFATWHPCGEKEIDFT